MTDEQKVQELLKPRYKVIGLYPRSLYYFELNEIIELPEFDNRTHLASQEWFVIKLPKYNKELVSSESMLPLTMHESTFNLYPHLFRKLEWWEERKPEEMPEYVRNAADRIVFKVEYNFNGHTPSDVHTWNDQFKTPFWHSLYDLLPATAADYKTFLSSVNKEV